MGFDTIWTWTCGAILVFGLTLLIKWGKKFLDMEMDSTDYIRSLG